MWRITVGKAFLYHWHLYWFETVVYCACRPNPPPPPFSPLINIVPHILPPSGNLVDTWKMAVFEVIGFDKIDDLRNLLDSDPKCVNAVAWHGTSALQRAATRGNKEIIKLLLERGADVNHCNAFDETALHFACQAAPIGCVHLLVQKGADIWKEDKAGRTCIHHAAKGGNV